jgi:hypothetical protein
MKELEYFKFGGGYDGILDETRFYNRTLDLDEIQTLNTHHSGLNFVGNVFYEEGLMTVTSREQRYKDAFRDGSKVGIRYKGSVTIYEHESLCTINKGEFNYSLNKSIRPNYNIDDERMISTVTGSDFAPYITTIGLYDDSYNLIAVGKLAEPVRNDPDLELTFAVRFDA